MLHEIGLLLHHASLLFTRDDKDTLLQGSGSLSDIPPAMYKASSVAINEHIFIMYGGRTDTTDGMHYFSVHRRACAISVHLVCI
jgi:hypothetical protein